VKFRALFHRVAITVVLCAAMSGCLPTNQGQFEEEKESHYLTGKNCERSMDFGGAIEAFEKAAEINPRSASAHFELGWLYEEKQKDPAAAIFHYNQYLKLRPNADNGEVVKQHVINCKQDLAKDVLPLPVAPGMQRELEQLAEENKKLRAENEQLKTYIAGLRQQSFTNPVSSPPARSTSTSSPQVTSDRLVPVTNRSTTNASRTHTVREGDTLASIARKYGVKLDALLAANPGLEPKRLRVGKSLNIPAQ
jgi:LysM repeat protein